MSSPAPSRPSASGSLSQLDFSELLQAIERTHATGRLVLLEGDDTREVAFRDGDFVTADSSEPDDGLGPFLLRHGAIRRDQLEQLRAAAAGRRLGPVLLENGWVSDELLADIQKQRAVELFVSLFDWTGSGTFEFHSGLGDDVAAAAPDVSTPDLVLKGIRSVKRWSRVAAGAGPPNAVFRLSGDLDRLTLPMTLSPEEWGVLGTYAEPRTLGEACHESELNDFRACQVTWSLRALGVLKREDEPESAELQAFEASLRAASSDEPADIAAAGVAPYRGTFTGLTLPDMLRALYLARQSGVLVTTSNEVTNRISFSYGTIVAARSSASEFRLGEVIERLHLVDRMTLEDLMADPSDEPLGQRLIAEGHLRQSDVDEVVEQQIRDIVRPMFGWREARYEFRPGAPDSGELPACDLSVAELILDGVRNMPDVGGIVRFLRGVKQPLAPHSDPRLRYQKARMRPAESDLLGRLDGGQDPTDLLASSVSTEDDVGRVLYGLLAAGFLEVAPASVARAVPGAPRSANGDSKPLAEAAIDDARASVEEAHHYDVLGLEPDADDDSIRMACVDRAREWHPDRGRTVSEKEKLDELFDRVVEAGRTLTEAREKADYDALLEAAADAEGSPAPPNDRTDSFKVGVAALKQGRHWHAIQQLRKVVEREPRHARAWLRLGDALSRNPQWNKDAEAAYTKAADLEPWLAEAHVGLGRLYLRAGMRARSRRQLEIALELDPADQTAQRELRNLAPAIDTTLGGVFRRIFQGGAADAR